jgi:hypothetical protein
MHKVLRQNFQYYIFFRFGDLFLVNNAKFGRRLAGMRAIDFLHDFTPKNDLFKKRIFLRDDHKLDPSFNVSDRMVWQSPTNEFYGQTFCRHSVKRTVYKLIFKSTLWTLASTRSSTFCAVCNVEFCGIRNVRAC